MWGRYALNQRLRSLSTVILPTYKAWPILVISALNIAYPSSTVFPTSSQLYVAVSCQASATATPAVGSWVTGQGCPARALTMTHNCDQL